MSQRVAFVLPAFTGGGAERVCINLAAAIDRRRFAPEIVVLDAGGPLRDAVPADVPVHDLGTPRLRRAMPRLVRMLRRIGPATTFSSIGYVNVALLALRRLVPGRIVVREANLPSLSLPNAGFPRLMAGAYRRLYRHADAVICTSRRMEEEFAGGFGVPRSRIAALPNPVDEDAVRAAAAAPLRPAGDGARFVAAGRLTRQKGFDRLIEMFAEMPETAHLTILGQGPDAPSLCARAEALGLGDRVDLPGFEPSPWARYAGADAFVLPSRWEGMPNAALEALACGTPVVATPEAGGIGEVAERSAAGAVTLAEAGGGFVAAMRAAAVDPVSNPRPSLLPPDFRLAAVVQRFETLIAD